MKGKLRLPQFVRRAPAVSVVAVAAALAVTGWALAEGELPLLSSDSADTTATATASTTTTTALGITAGGGGDNVAAAVNTKDGKTVFALAIKITQTTSEVVDPVNAAVAVASCADCQTVAIALEAVLVAGSPDTFEPTNIALAINSECSNCQTLAAAYQNVVQNDTRVRISGAGRREIAAIRTDLLALRNSGLDIFTIQKKVDEAAARFLKVLQTEVYPTGPPPTTTTVPASGAAATTTTTTSSTTSTTVQATMTTVQSTSTTVP